MKIEKRVGEHVDKIVGQRVLLSVDDAGDNRRDGVISVRVTGSTLLCIDLLLHAGVARSRSDAAALLIDSGIRSKKALFDKIEALKQDIADIRTLAEGLASTSEENA